MIEIALNEIDEVSSSLVRRCKTYEDALAVATALCIAAEKIYASQGGSKHAALQFYAIADQAAVK